MRVSPHAPLQDLAPIICSKCEFDPLHTVLLKDYQAQEPLDLTKSLNDLGLRELYAMDISRGKQTFPLSPLKRFVCVFVCCVPCVVCIDRCSQLHNASDLMDQSYGWKEDKKKRS